MLPSKTSSRSKMRTSLWCASKISKMRTTWLKSWWKTLGRPKIPPKPQRMLWKFLRKTKLKTNSSRKTRLNLSKLSKAELNWWTLTPKTQSSRAFFRAFCSSNLSLRTFCRNPLKRSMPSSRKFNFLILPSTSTKRSGKTISSSTSTATWLRTTRGTKRARSIRTPVRHFSRKMRAKAALLKMFRWFLTRNLSASNSNSQKRIKNLSRIWKLEISFFWLGVTMPLIFCSKAKIKKSSQHSET